jgi:hypothetical protein
MRMYTVLEHRPPKGRGKAPRSPDEAFVLVKDGFSWPGFFFGPLWALSRRMWVVGALLIALVIGVGFVPQIIENGDTLVPWLMLSVGLLVGFLGNDLHVWSLERAGYELVGVVGGTDLTDAERRLFASMGSLMYGR